jgi:transposase InsO family protein
VASVAAIGSASFDMAIQKRRPQAGHCIILIEGANIPMESFFAQLENELLAQGPFDTCSKGKQEVFDYIEAYYNRTRIHSTLGYLSPVDFEAKHWHGVTI